LGFKPDAPSDICSQAVLLRDILLPKGQEAQVVNYGQLG